MDHDGSRELTDAQLIHAASLITFNYYGFINGLLGVLASFRFLSGSFLFCVEALTDSDRDGLLLPVSAHSST